MKLHFLIAMTLVFSGCATYQQNNAGKAEKWKAIGDSEEFQAERETWQKRMSGVSICHPGIGISDYLYPNSLQAPDSKCLYFASGLLITREGILFETERALRQSLQQLKVLQVLENGFVVTSPNYRGNQIVFIHKTSEQGIVDGGFLDNQNLLLYKYAGPYRYQSLSGPKTVHSFKKLTSDEVKSSVDGLKLYDPFKELYIKYELWDRLP